MTVRSLILGHRCGTGTKETLDEIGGEGDVFGIGKFKWDFLLVNSFQQFEMVQLLLFVAWHGRMDGMGWNGTGLVH